MAASRSETKARAIRFIVAVALTFITLPAAAQTPMPPPASSPANPFPDQRPGFYQPADEQVLPLLPPGIPLAPPPGANPPIEAQQPVSLGDLIFGDNRKTPDEYRSGAFQKMSFTNTYLPRMGGDGFGTYDVELTSAWALPCPTKDAPLVITPGVANHWLDGPAGLDIPAQLHDVYTEFRWLPKVTDQLRADIAVQPGFFSDWDGSSVRAVRVLGHGTAIYDWTPTLAFVLGAAYLDRPDIEVLPVVGIVWKPDEGVEYRLVFPTPRISWRFWDDRFALAAPQRPRWDHELWLYVGGELGGGTWAIRHSDGTSDLMSYSDIRVYLGLENRTLVGLGTQLEIGYVFHRYIRLASTDSNFDVGDTLMARAIVNY